MGLVGVTQYDAVDLVVDQQSRQLVGSVICGAHAPHVRHAVEWHPAIDQEPRARRGEHQEPRVFDRGEHARTRGRVAPATVRSPRAFSGCSRRGRSLRRAAGSPLPMRSPQRTRRSPRPRMGQNLRAGTPPSSDAESHGHDRAHSARGSPARSGSSESWPARADTRTRDPRARPHRCAPCRHRQRREQQRLHDRMHDATTPGRLGCQGCHSVTRWR